jgi:hypothetical protein
MAVRSTDALVDVLAPERGMWAVYPLLLINLVNLVSWRLDTGIFFYEPSRFDGVLAIASVIAVASHALSLRKERRGPRRS